VSWTGTGTNGATIGHGLGTAPSCIILKNRDASGGIGDWYVGHDGIGWTDRLKLNTDCATAASSTLWNNTAPTSSVFTVSSALNANGDATSPTASQRKKDLVSLEATQVMEVQMEHLFIQDLNQLLLWLKTIQYGPGKIGIF
jgi:hypothetical protein